MSLISRLFKPKPDEHAMVRPLWEQVIALGREPGWYGAGGIADTVSGRFDAITLVLALVMLRMERDPVLRRETGRLAELFVADIAGQLREMGIGDPSMAKRMGKLIGHFGGRLDAYRVALAERDETALAAAIDRNVTLAQGADLGALAVRVRALADRLAARDSSAILAGEIG